MVAGQSLVEILSLHDILRGGVAPASRRLSWGRPAPTLGDARLVGASTNLSRHAPAATPATWINVPAPGAPLPAPLASWWDPQRAPRSRPLQLPAIAPRPKKFSCAPALL